MLKSPVFVTLCSVLLINSLPASAHFYGSYTPPGLGVSSLISYRLPALRMQKFVDSYIKENDEELTEVRERSSQPFLIIDSVMDRYDLPEELRYLAVIESELRASAVSRVGAKGPWQLMAGTARDLGLKVSRRSDERTNYYKSTVAAALYLRDLHREFKDWLLVLAAYNAGPVPVNRAIRLAGSRNFWALERYLPGETRQHVRRFIATAYYFSVSGPVSDPVRAVPGVGFPGVCAAGVPGGMVGVVAGVVGVVAGPIGVDGGSVGVVAGPIGVDGGLVGAVAGPIGVDGGPNGVDGGILGDVRRGGVPGDKDGEAAMIDGLAGRRMDGMLGVGRCEAGM